MKLPEYNTYCSELAELAARARNLKGIAEETQEELKEIHESVVANHFRIVLMGSYQSGKSTIFNTACGGRELSPTGFGIRTSAVPAEAHVVQEGESEFAVIRWKSDEELLTSFLESLLPELIDLDKRFKGNSVEEAAAKLKLSEEKDRELLRRALSDAKRHYQDHREEYSSDHIELLLISALIIENHKWFQANLKDSGDRQSEFSVEDATRVIRFPKNWNQHPDPREYGWEDIRFLFIRSVEFHLDSPDLRKLKAVLVDCPGLHASRWDNEVIRDCISRSDAIVWLQGGEGRELSRSDLEDASRLGDYGITSNGIFLAFNAKGTTKKASKQILESNLHKIREALNLDLPEERVVIFNALMALRGMQSRSLQDGKLPAASIEALSNLAAHQWDQEDLPEEGKNADQNAQFLLKRDLRRTADRFLGVDLEDFENPREIEKLIERSHWQDVVGQASEFVLQTRARTRLIDRGADRIALCLTRCEESLRATEKSADKDLEEHEREKTEAEDALTEFDTGADALVRRIRDAFKGFQDATDKGSGVGSKIVSELQMRMTAKSSIAGLKRRLANAVDKAKSEREVQGLLQGVATEWMHEIIAGWQVDVRNGKSDAMRAFYAENLASYEEKMRELLQNAIGKSGGLLRTISFKSPEIDSDLLKTAHANAFKRSLKHLDKIFDWFDKQLWGKARYLRDGYEKCRKFFTGSSFDREAWKARIDEYVDKLRGQIIDEVVPKTSKELIAAYRKAIVNRIDRAKRKLREDYEKNVKEMDEVVSKAVKEREALAEEATRIRSSIIEPFHEEVREFATKVDLCLAELERD